MRLARRLALPTIDQGRAIGRAKLLLSRGDFSAESVLTAENNAIFRREGLCAIRLVFN
jgi:hypothetical protein